MKITSETFVIPNGGDYFVFAPLRGVLVKADRAGVTQLARVIQGDAALQSDHPLFVQLRKFGVIDGVPDRVLETPPYQGYDPTHVTLFLSSECNLACHYCYADANEHQLRMPIHLGEAAIDYIVANALRKQSGAIEITYHGGGEPTMAWEEMQHFTEYGKRAARDNGLRVRVCTITNGCISASKARWIARNLDGATLSWDGPPDIHNGQRPTVGGGESAHVVEQTAAIFDEEGVQYGIQATITAQSTARMTELVRYFAGKAGTKTLKFEPVSTSGRFTGQEEKAPSLREFADGFNEAWEVAREYGIDLMFSAATRILGKPMCYFCGAMAQPFAVTPDSKVSACYEVSSTGKEFDDVFMIGRYIPETRGFEVDPEKLAHLRSRSVNNMDMCKKCFCKYSCSGDCPARNMHGAHETSPSIFANGRRCEAIREIARYQLARRLDAAPATEIPELRESLTAAGETAVGTG